MGSRTGYGNHIYFLIPIVKKYINLNSGTKRVLAICLILLSSTKLLRVPMIFSILSLQLRTEKIRCSVVWVIVSCKNIMEDLKKNQDM